MKAPEKIYRTTTYLDNDKGKTVWKNAPVAGAENIEYIRTDAFIEKAVSYIQQHWIWNTKIIEDFKKYMEEK